MLDKTAAEQLLQKYYDGHCSDEELALLESWYNQYQPEDPQKLSDQQWAEDVYAIVTHLDDKTQPAPRLRYPVFQLAAAAVVVLAVCFGGYRYFHKKEPSIAQRQAKIDFTPGGNKATLTLASGRSIVLDGSANGDLAREGNTTIKKTKDGQVIYKITDQPADEAAGANNPGANNAGRNTISTNTISTPAGGQYQVQLADGTNVWLNSASSITYPTTFNGQNRVVSITGEAYFAVAQNAKKPFLVRSMGQEVEVLGTEFNINSYEDEPFVKTTLLEGKVRVNDKTILLPGQQTRLANRTTQAGTSSPSGPAIAVSAVDTELAIAWKNNKFMFDNDDIQTIMRMIARWYNVKIEYAGNVAGLRFSGSVSRFNNIDKVLGILELADNVHFTIQGRTILVAR